VKVRFGGKSIGDDVHLEVRAGMVSGRFSGAVLGKDVQLHGAAGRLTGRIGGPNEGKDAHLKGHGVPLEVMALAAMIAYKAFDESQPSD
jgi:hypothetical protein